MELPDRSNYEAQFRKELRTLAKRHHAEFLRLLGSPPDVNNVPDSFWQKVDQENEDALLLALLLVYLASSRFHGNPLADNDRGARSFAERHASQSARRFGSTSRDMARVLGRDIEAKVAEDFKGRPMTKSEVESRSRRIFGDARVDRLSTNETTIAQTEGGESAIKKTVGLSPDDIWRVNPQLSRTGPCPICAPLSKKKRPEWGQFVNGPPAHVGCVCDIIYANMPNVLVRTRSR